MEKLQQLEKELNKLGYFPISYLMRDDIKDNSETEEFIDVDFTDEEMKMIAKDMEASYLETGQFWDDLATNTTRAADIKQRNTVTV